MEDLKKAGPADGSPSAFAAREPAGAFDGSGIDVPLSEYMEKKMGCQGSSALRHPGGNPCMDTSLSKSSGWPSFSGL
jgi:hypothetical protein